MKLWVLILAFFTNTHAKLQCSTCICRSSTVVLVKIFSVVRLQIEHG